MAQFLRDQQIRNLSVSIDRIEEIFNAFLSRAEALRVAGNANVVVSCVIRFDECGHRVFSFDDISLLYRQAKTVERLVFSIETAVSLNSNRHYGAYVDLTLEKNNSIGFLTVSDDDRAWVDGTFSLVRDVLIKCRAWYGFIRTVWTELIVQVVGVALIFFLSLLAASKISPNIVVESNFLISFLFVFLLFSNIWNYLQRQVYRAIGAIFPNVEFIRVGREHIHWLLQGAVSTAVLVIIGYVINETSTALLNASAIIIKVGGS